MSKEPEIYCSIHLGNSPISQALTLTCNHRFCIDCLLGDWTNSINNGFVDASRLKCPEDGCNVPITYNELKGNLPESVFKKYEEFSFNNFVGQNKEGTEKTVICPDVKCQIKSLIWAEASFFTCWNCKKKYCAACLGEWTNHEGLNCDEFKKNEAKGLKKEDLAMEKMVEEEKWMKCPKCKSIVEKIEFCNFIRCRSNICQKNTCFCYLCGDILTEKTHYTHFKDNNPYNDVCVNYNRVKEKNMEKKEKKPLKNLLKKACPGCKTNNPDICENLWDAFTKCSNKTCKYKAKIVCVKCLMNFREDQGELLLTHPSECEGANPKCMNHLKKCCIF